MSVVVVSVAGMWAAACASTSQAVPLAVPDPPARAAIAPVPLPETPQAERPAPRTPAPVTQESPEPPPGRQAPPVPVVANPPAAPPTTPPAGPPAAPPTAPTDLRSGGPGAPTISAAQVRELLTRASQKLDALDRRQLSAGRQVDYDNARRFLSQAEAALKTNNLMLAHSSAEKAETLADGLR